MIAVEGRSNFLVAGCVRQHVTGNLFDRELIEGHVSVKSVNDPVSPPPHAAHTIALIAVGIRITCRVQPAHSHTFPVTRRLEKAVNYLFVRIRRCVLEEGIDFSRSWRQPGEVKGRPANQGALVRFRRWNKLLSFQAGESKMVNRIARPVTVLDLRWLHPLGRNEGPVFLPLRPLLDPTTDQVDFPIGHLRLAGIGGWHPHRLVV